MSSPEADLQSPCGGRADDCSGRVPGVSAACIAPLQLPPLPAPGSTSPCFLAATRLPYMFFSCGDSGERGLVLASTGETWSPSYSRRLQNVRGRRETVPGPVIGNGSPPLSSRSDWSQQAVRAAPAGGATCRPGGQPPAAALSPGSRFKGCGTGYFGSAGNNDGGQADRGGGSPAATGFDGVS